jgi:hypothetical protein
MKHIQNNHRKILISLWILKILWKKFAKKSRDFCQIFVISNIKKIHRLGCGFKNLQKIYRLAYSFFIFFVISISTLF